MRWLVRWLVRWLMLWLMLLMFLGWMGWRGEGEWLKGWLRWLV